MLPAHTPLPMPTSLPFQFSAGIQTSILISESGVGVSVAVTRQKAGAFLKTASPPGPPIIGMPTGGVNWPAATRDAEVIFPSGSSSDARVSQVAGGAGAGKENNTILIRAVEMIRIKLFNISDSLFY